MIKFDSMSILTRSDDELEGSIDQGETPDSKVGDSAEFGESGS